MAAERSLPTNANNFCKVTKKTQANFHPEQAKRTSKFRFTTPIYRSKRVLVATCAASWRMNGKKLLAFSTTRDVRANGRFSNVPRVKRAAQLHWRSRSRARARDARRPWPTSRRNQRSWLLCQCACMHAEETLCQIIVWVREGASWSLLTALLGSRQCSIILVDRQEPLRLVLLEARILLKNFETGSGLASHWNMLTKWTRASDFGPVFVQNEWSSLGAGFGWSHAVSWTFTGLTVVLSFRPWNGFTSWKTWTWI